MNKGFIQQTAQDYDMPVNVVENYYYSYYNQGTFYEKLEEYIADRANGES